MHYLYFHFNNIYNYKLEREHC